MSSPTTLKLVEKSSVKGHHDLSTLCIRFNKGGNLIAEGCGSGDIKLINTKFGYSPFQAHEAQRKLSPITAITFRPDTMTNSQLIVSANANGFIEHWHQNTGKCLHSFEDISPVYTLDYNKSGTFFISAGKDTSIRLYDDATKSLITEMKGNDSSVAVTPSHSSRIYACKINPYNENCVLSGGWDNTIQIWDVRCGHSVRYMYGPHICGEALDICENEILSGSWRTTNQLELWDFGSGQKIQDIPWILSDDDKRCEIYAAQFSKEGRGKYIVAGGSGANEARVFDRSTGFSVVGAIQGFSSAVVSVDFCEEEDWVAVASKDSTIRIFEVEDSSNKSKRK
jgi:COMPASS component SWD3